jgi:hypothetical protein
MNITLQKLTSGSVLAAYAASIAFQGWRASLDTSYSLDAFSPGLAAGYLVAVVLAVMLWRSDRRWLWWANGLLAAAVVLEAVFYYYPTAYDQKPLGVADWLEGTWFTGFLLLAVVGTALRLRGLTLTRRTV